VFGGVFHGVPSLDGIVQTLEFEGRPGHVSLRTVTFAEHGSKTMLSQNTVFQTVEDRDRELESGMGEEAGDSVERLDELLARFASVR
jgi:hypothetical protein